MYVKQTANEITDSEEVSWSLPRPLVSLFCKRVIPYLSLLKFFIECSIEDDTTLKKKFETSKPTDCCYCLVISLNYYHLWTTGRKIKINGCCFTQMKEGTDAKGGTSIRRN